MATENIESKSLVTTTEHRVMGVVADWLNQEKTVWLCTIVKTWGSSPRPSGSILAYQEESGVVGSLSGGCIEEALIRQFSSDSSDLKGLNKPFLYDYSISVEDQTQYKLPCGGQLTILVERLNPTPHIVQHFDEIHCALNLRQRVRRTVSLLDGSMKFALTTEAFTGRDVVQSNDSIEVVFGPIFKMLLLGAGEVSYSVASIAMSVGFSVTVCDPREAFLQGYQQSGVEVIRCLPDDLVRERFSDSYSAILALAHDPRVDDMALMEALKTKAFYIGAMGSVRTSDDRRKRLAELDCSPLEIDQLHSPIGIDIGSKRPTEIAVSIMAQVLAERNSFLGRTVDTSHEKSLNISNHNIASCVIN
jgi:xanthine dehydrogenase accessory factor